MIARDILLTILIAIALLCLVGIAEALKYLYYLNVDLKTKSEIMQNFAVGIAVIIGGVWAVYRFFIQRSYETALEIDLSTTQFVCENSRFLVFIDTALKNKGQTRISARPKKYRKDKVKPVYRDEAETLYHSVSLQIRRINTNTKSSAVFDWFESTNLEQIDDLPAEINLINEYDISRDGVIDFWIEPNEIYHCAIPVVIPSGQYLAKVSFLGHRGNFEFWSRLFHFNVG